MREFLFLSLVGVAALLVQTTALAFAVPLEYKPDLMLIAVVWAALNSTFLPGICFSFLGGLLVDMLSGSPTGMFALIYSLIFVTCGYLNEVLSVEGPTAIFMLVLGASVCSGVAVLWARWLNSPTDYSWAAFWWVLGKSLATAATAAAVLPLTRSAGGGYERFGGSRRPAGGERNGLL